jgi:hypothetical protein
VTTDQNYRKTPANSTQPNNKLTIPFANINSTLNHQFNKELIKPILPD